MAAEFVTLADLLRAPAAVEPAPPAVAEPPAAGGFEAVPERAPELQAEVLAAVREARLFRARLADALDAASARLIRELACDVLARELKLAPCDVDALLRRILERAPGVRVRVAPADVARVGALPCVADPALVPGDAVVELDGGVLDARFGVRLATVLEGFA